MARTATTRVTSLKEFSDPVLKCRSLGHAWDPSVAFVERIDRKPVIRLELQCLRCPTARTDVIARKDGLILGRRYGYPVGYLVADRSKWGPRTVMLGNLRQELANRMLSNGNGRKK